MIAMVELDGDALVARCFSRDVISDGSDIVPSNSRDRPLQSVPVNSA